MAFCDVSKCQRGGDRAVDGIRIFYRTYGSGKTKVLLIIGLSGTHDSWGPQIKGLTGSEVPNDVDENLNDPDPLTEEEGDGIQVCSFDNRGMGRSSVPTKKSRYTTTIMAKDALALLDHLGWRKAHVFGHSMGEFSALLLLLLPKVTSIRQQLERTGAMIACKLAAMAPNRISSLALLNVTGGGFECLPKIDRQMMSIAIRFLRARTPEQRAAVDLDTHYTKEYLDEYVGSITRRKFLYQEYVKAISSTGMQSNCGFEGQINSCWSHKMRSKEIDVIRSSDFLISVIHGRHDIIAQICHAKRLADKLRPAARMIEFHGGHLVSHEKPEEVHQALMELIKSSESKMNPQEWSNTPSNGFGTSKQRRSFGACVCG